MLVRLESGRGEGFELDAQQHQLVVGCKMVCVVSLIYKNLIHSVEEFRALL